MLYFIDVSEFNKINVECYNLTNSELKLNKINTILDAS